jgi:hypothetical protein
MGEVDEQPIASEERRITSVELGAEGWGIGYMTIPTDIRKNGLMWQHHVFVPIGSDYDEELDAAYIALSDLLDDVLDDEERAEPVDLAESEEEEENDDDE